MDSFCYSDTIFHLHDVTDIKKTQQLPASTEASQITQSHRRSWEHDPVWGKVNTHCTPGVQNQVRRGKTDIYKERRRPHEASRTSTSRIFGHTPNGLLLLPTSSVSAARLQSEFVVIIWSQLKNPACHYWSKVYERLFHYWPSNLSL